MRPDQARETGGEAETLRGRLEPLNHVLVTRRLPGGAVDGLRQRLGGTAGVATGTAAVRHWDSDEPMPRDALLSQVRGASGLLAF